MGWLDTPEQRRRQHLQMVATGNIRDIDRIQERERKRRVDSVFWALFIIGIIFGVISFKGGAKELSYYCFGIALIGLIALLYRYGFYRKIKFKNKSNGWESLDHVPDWVFKKMKRKHKHKVNGDHYVYKREGKNFYRKLK